MQETKTKHAGSRGGSGAWTVALLATALILLGLLVYGRKLGWDLGLPFLKRDPPPSPMVSLPDVVVGLRGGGPDLYVDAAFDLEVASEQDREAVRRHLPRVREETIEVLSALSPEELRGNGELAKVKSRLLERFRNVMPSQRLHALYLTYLAVARRDDTRR